MASPYVADQVVDFVIAHRPSTLTHAVTITEVHDDGSVDIEMTIANVKFVAYSISTERLRDSAALANAYRED